MWQPTAAAVRDAITALPVHVWRPAVTADSGLGDGVEITKITNLLTLRWPAGMRVLIRRERPHPGARLDAFRERDGHRYQAVCTNTGRGRVAFLETRHRAHARVEDRIRCGKDTGIGRFPPATSRSTPLDRSGGRLLHTAARITRGQRKTYLRLAKNWPWALALAQAFTRLRTIPLPT